MLAMFIGPSACGKDTFFKSTLERYDLNPVVLHTTRPIRTGEIDGKTYHFVSKEKLDLLEQKKLLIERRDYKTVEGIWSYATCASGIDIVHQNYLMLNTWVAYQQFLTYWPDYQELIYPIFFQVEDGLRLERALAREKKQPKGNYAELCRRFLADKEDFSEDLLDRYQPKIIDNNSSYEHTQEQIDSYMQLLLRK